MEAKEIKEILSGYVKSIDDIYWLQRINALLSDNKQIEKKNFKLWLSSTNIINNILHNSNQLKSTYLESEIKTKLSLYVRNEKHDYAYDFLLKNKVIVITGAPGVGKTTLANILTYRLLGEKNCQLLIVENNIEEAERIISPNPEEKQLIYFDDFLGANIYQILNPKNTENSLVQFVKRIKSFPNKYLILTSRTTILNQAVENYEHFKLTNFHKISQFEIRLPDYTDLDRAKILYNHIYFSLLSKEYRDKLIENKNYLKIIKHRNFNPRIIEFFTNHNIINEIKERNYFEFVINTLENPKEIWKGSYTNQLFDEDRFLLTSLLTFKGTTNLKILEEVFETRISYEVQKNGYQLKENTFNKSVKRLLKSYLNSVTHPKAKNIIIRFSNPSIGDFLINHLKESSSEKKRILYSIEYLEQLLNLFHPVNKDFINLTKKELEDFFHYFRKNEKKYKVFKKNSSIKLELLHIYFTYFNEFLSAKIIKKLLKKGTLTKTSNHSI